MLRAVYLHRKVLHSYARLGPLLTLTDLLWGFHRLGIRGLGSRLKKGEQGLKIETGRLVAKRSTTGSKIAFVLGS